MNIFQDLQNKVAIVTGGNRGVGAGIVDVLADCGVKLMIAARDTARNQAKCAEVAARGGLAVAWPTDVSQEANVTALALHYVASKGANIAFTWSLAQALRKSGVTVNCIAAGAVETPKEWTLGPAETCRQVLADIEEAQLVARRLQPRDIGWLVAYLCTEVTRFIDGQALTIDGGRSWH